MSLEKSINHLTDDEKRQMLALLKASIEDDDNQIEIKPKKRKRKRKSKKHADNKDPNISTYNPSKDPGRIRKGRRLKFIDQSLLSGTEQENKDLQAKNNFDEIIKDQYESGSIGVSERVPRSAMVEVECHRCRRTESVYTSNAGFKVVDGSTIYLCNTCSTNGAR